MTKKYRDDIRQAVIILASKGVVAEERMSNVWEVDCQRYPMTELQVIALAQNIIDHET